MATSEGIPSSIDIEFLELNDNPYLVILFYNLLLSTFQRLISLNTLKYFFLLLLLYLSHRIVKPSRFPPFDAAKLLLFTYTHKFYH